MISDYQRIADEVRGFIESADQTRDSVVDALAESYAAASKEASVRLRRCGDLLHRGLRSEALHLAQESPDLLDMVAALDIPGIEAWEEMCAAHSLPKPARLSLELAAELNDAYSAEEPLKASLDELRLLAIARAPVRARLAVTRRLRSLDPETAHWAEDAAALERVVLQNLRHDVGEALKSGDANVVHRLLDDLTSPDWINLPPKDLVEPLVVLDLENQMKAIVSAQLAGKVVDVRRSVDALQRSLKARKIKLPGKYAEEFSAANAWLIQHDEHAADKAAFDDRCEALAAEIERGAPRAHIDALWSQITKWGHPVPDHVLDAYERTKFTSRVVSNRAKLQYAAIAAIVVACIAAGAWTAISRRRDGDTARAWLSRVELAIGQYDFETAKQSWTQLAKQSPNVAAREDVQQAHQRLDAASDAEAKRLHNFETAMTEAEATDSPAAVRESRLVSAEMYARLDTDRLRVIQVRARLEEANVASLGTPPATLPSPDVATTATVPSSESIAPQPAALPVATPATAVPAPATPPVIDSKIIPVDSTLPAGPKQHAEAAPVNHDPTDASPKTPAKEPSETVMVRVPTWKLTLNNVAQANRVVFVCDASTDFAGTQTFAHLQSQLREAVNGLKERQAFSIVVATGGKGNATTLKDTGALTFATADSKAAADKMIADIKAAGVGDHVAALRAALHMKPDIAYLILNGAEPSKINTAELHAVTATLNATHASQLNVILIGSSPTIDVKGLQVFATENNGKLVQIDDNDRTMLPAN